MEKSILFYDSGIGGLSTLAKTIQLLPHENFIYFADNANVPYGNKTQKQVCELVLGNISVLLNQFKVKMIVIACNTATSLAIDEIRAKIHIPVVGIEPAIFIAKKKSKSKHILVIATKGTISSKRFLILKKSSGCTVHSLALKKLASKIENGFLTNSLNIFEEIELINKIKSKDHKIDQIILGCTHYSFIADEIQAKTNLQVSDGNFGVAKNIKRILEQNSMIKTNGLINLKIILSSKKHEDEKKYANILKKLIQSHK